MARSGYYEDPLGQHFSRFYNGKRWTYMVRDESGQGHIPDDFGLSDEILGGLNPPTDVPADNSTDEHNYPTLLDFYRMASPPKRSKVVADHGSADPREDGWIVGQNGMVRLRDGLVEIKRTSISTDLLLGNLRGDKAIPIRNIQAVQFKPASQTVGGMIEFVVAGDRSNTGSQRDGLMEASGLVGALMNRRWARMANENVLTFSRGQELPFLDFHKLILNEIGRFGSPQTPVASAVSRGFSTEIRELKDLLDDGILTQAEFDSAKQEILKNI